MNKYIFILVVIIPLKLVASETIVYEKKVHSDNVDSLCISKKSIISASFDRSINETLDNKSKAIGKHEDWVRKVICIGSNIISASNDGTISIWNNVKKIHSVQAHDWWVTDISFYDGKIVSVSLDETVKVWSYPELKLLYSHKIYGSNKHHSVIINNGKAFIGSTRGVLHVLDLNDYNQLDRKQVNWYGESILISSAKSFKYIFFGTSDGFIMQVNAFSPYNRISKTKVSDFSLKALVQSQGFLYIGDDNGVLRKVGIDNIRKHYILNNFSESVRTLAIDSGFIYAGYDEGYVRIFNDVLVTDEVK